MLLSYHVELTTAMQVSEIEALSVGRSLALPNHKPCTDFYVQAESNLYYVQKVIPNKNSPKKERANWMSGKLSGSPQ